jgi:cysteine-rich repeat protein
MARTLALLLPLLPACGCLYPWDYDATTTTGDASSSGSSGSTGDTSTSTSTPMTEGSASGTQSTSGDPASTSTATTDATGTTTGAPPVCGDGAINAPDEECDDANLDPDDGCSAACARDRLVFATSLLFSPDHIGGLAGADSLCKQLAHKADLPRWASFTAWLSDSTADARDRVHHGRGRYLRPDATPVAASFDALLAGPLLAPIAIDEFGQPAVGAAWTGTRPDGTAVPNASHCADWTSNDFFDKGHYGVVTALDTRWTFESTPDTNPIFCTTQSHLYCFEGK